MLDQSAPVVAILLQLWSIFWVGISLWRASRFEQKWWFIAILLFGYFTAGLLPIVYLFWFSKKRFSLREVKEWKFWKKSSPKDK